MKFNTVYKLNSTPQERHQIKENIDIKIMNDSEEIFFSFMFKNIQAARKQKIPLRIAYQQK
jgi:hypothetical protein